MYMNFHLWTENNKHVELGLLDAYILAPLHQWHLVDPMVSWAWIRCVDIHSKIEHVLAIV